MNRSIKFGIYTLIPAVLAQSLTLAADDTATLEQRIQALEKQLQANAGLVATTTNGRSIAFARDDYSFQLGGRLQLDAAAYDPKQEGNDFGDGTRIRRLFLDIRGTVYERWNYRFQYDFARPSGSDSSARGIRDAWIQYTGFAPAITFGQFKEPFGLEHLTSSLNTTFIELGLTNVFTPDRRIGLGLSDNSRHWSYSLGVFGEPAEGDVPDEGHESWDITGRLTYAPLNSDGNVVHLGLAGRQHTPEDSGGSLRFRERPESNVTDVQLIDTDTLTNVKDVQYLGLEAATVFGPLSIQGEWVDTHLSRDSGAENLNLSAWYTYASLFLTGESRSYKNGIFDRITPKAIVGQGGIGAWQVALRYSKADLNDGPVIGGEEEDVTLGVNWYATPNIRFAANYIKVLELDRPGNRYHNEKLDSVVLRTQIDF